MEDVARGGVLLEVDSVGGGDFALVSNRDVAVQTAPTNMFQDASGNWLRICYIANPASAIPTAGKDVEWLDQETLDTLKALFNATVKELPEGALLTTQGFWTPQGRNQTPALTHFKAENNTAIADIPDKIREAREEEKQSDRRPDYSQPDPERISKKILEEIRTYETTEPRPNPAFITDKFAMRIFFGIVARSLGVDDGRPVAVAGNASIARPRRGSDASSVDDEEASQDVLQKLSIARAQLVAIHGERRVHAYEILFFNEAKQYQPENLTDKAFKNSTMYLANLLKDFTNKDIDRALQA